NATEAAKASYSLNAEAHGATYNIASDATTSAPLPYTATLSTSAPPISNNTVTATEDTLYTFQTSDFPFSDPNDSPANSLLNVIRSAQRRVGTECANRRPRSAARDDGAYVRAGMENLRRKGAVYDGRNRE